MELYSECAKGSDIMIDDPILMRQVDHTMNRLVRLGNEGGKNKRYAQIFRDYDMVGMIRSTWSARPLYRESINYF